MTTIGLDEQITRKSVCIENSRDGSRSALKIKRAHTVPGSFSASVSVMLSVPIKLAIGFQNHTRPTDPHCDPTLYRSASWTVISLRAASQETRDPNAICALLLFSTITAAIALQISF